MDNIKKVTIERGRFGNVIRDYNGQPMLQGDSFSDVKLRDTFQAYMERRALISEAKTPKDFISRLVNGRKNYHIAIGLLRRDLSGIGYDFNEIFPKQTGSISNLKFSELIPHRPTTRNIKKLRDTINTQLSFD